MNEYFKEKVKPLNDVLGGDLNIKTIEIRSEDKLWHITVMVTIQSAKGGKLTMPSSQLRFYRAIGLLI